MNSPWDIWDLCVCPNLRAAREYVVQIALRFGQEMQITENASNYRIRIVVPQWRKPDFGLGNGSRSNFQRPKVRAPKLLLISLRCLLSSSSCLAARSRFTAFIGDIGALISPDCHRNAIATHYYRHWEKNIGKHMSTKIEFTFSISKICLLCVEAISDQLI